MFDELRPHVFFKNQRDKWLKKIDPKTSPLIKKFGLDAAFFNPDLTDEVRKNISFNFKPQRERGAELSVSFMAKDSLAKARQLQLMSEQLYVAFGRQMLYDTILRNRLSAIDEFLGAKRLKLLMEKKDKQKETNPQKIAAHAFLKYISYVQLHYALTHDKKGQELGRTPEVPSIEQTLSKSALMGSMMLSSSQVIQADSETTTTTTVPQNLTESMVTITNRIDSILQAEAQKWGQRLLDLEEESGFLETNALRASMFVQ